MPSFSPAPKLYGLLHVAETAAAHANLAAGARDPLDIYLRSAALCAASVAAAGGSFALVTNDVGRLDARRAALGLGDLEVIGHSFHWPVPKGIAFYSAHFKLELIEAFATGAFGDLVGLIDVDTVLQKPLDLPGVETGALAAYDITRIECASYGEAVIRGDIETVAGRRIADPRWYGGEFILGAPQAFAALVREIKICWPQYVAALGRLNHTGDEMAVSAALNRAREGGLAIVNADCPGGVVRWWTARTNAPFPPFCEIAGRSLLHLPADKEFLAAYPRVNFDAGAFVAAYRRYAGPKLRSRRLANWAQRLLGRERKFVARLN